MRNVTPLNEAFFNDGHWYVLSSSSLGGAGLSIDEICQKMQSQDPDIMNKTLSDGICFPVYFPGDCALDQAVIIQGDLSEKEEREWIARLSSKINIPCGEFMIMGGAMEEDFEVALENFTPPDPHFQFFQKLKLEPGEYRIDLYAFLGSMTVNFAWEDQIEEIVEWAKTSSPDGQKPKWLENFIEEEYIDAEDEGLLEYIIRISPCETPLPLPELDEDCNWPGIFEVRHPNICPKGILRKDYCEE